ncbi:methyltransferase, partial [Oryctes borbonicus]
MNYANKWFKTTITKQAVLRYLQNYGHLLKWQNYKEHVLEVGCGEGSITKNILFSHIKDRVHKLVAVDKLDAMIVLAKKESQEEEIEYQILDIMDERRIEKMQSQFEHIFSFFVAHLIPDNRAFFNGLWKMLKPGGQVFVTMFSDHCFKRSFYRQSKEDKWAKYIQPETIFTDYTDKPDEYLRGLLTDVGFQVDICKVEHRTYQ